MPSKGTAASVHFGLAQALSDFFSSISYTRRVQAPRWTKGQHCTRIAHDGLFREWGWQEGRHSRSGRLGLREPDGSVT